MVVVEGDLVFKPVVAPNNEHNFFKTLGSIPDFKPRLVGLTGKARSGKDTVGSILEEHFASRRVAFADPIREMLAEGFGFNYNHFHGKLKEVVIPEYGKSPRQMMQTLGTEWGRLCVKEDVWLTLAKISITEFLEDEQHVVVTDVRFENEAELIRSMGGSVWHVVRDTAQSVNSHPSENGVVFNPKTDYVVSNNGTLEELDSLVTDLFFKQCTS